MREISIEGLTQPPDYERRCNGFIREVLDVVAPKYPDLGFDAWNDTLGKHPAEDTYFAIVERVYGEDSVELEKQRATARRRHDQKDRISAFLNEAKVHVWSAEFGIRRRYNLCRAVREIRQVSRKYQPLEIDIEDTDVRMAMRMIRNGDIPVDGRLKPYAQLNFTFK